MLSIMFTNFDSTDCWKCPSKIMKGLIWKEFDIKDFISLSTASQTPYTCLQSISRCSKFSLPFSHTTHIPLDILIFFQSCLSINLSMKYFPIQIFAFSRNRVIHKITIKPQVPVNNITIKFIFPIAFSIYPCFNIKNENLVNILSCKVFQAFLTSGLLVQHWFSQLCKVIRILITEHTCFLFPFNR